MRLFVALILLCLSANALQAQPPRQLRYQVEATKNLFRTIREQNGENKLFVTVQFRILNLDGTAALDVGKDEIVILEDGQRVDGLEVTRPKADCLTTVLALDVSGSMSVNGKWDEAQAAARTFLDLLGPRSDTGLVLFDHLMRVKEPPSTDPGSFTQHRAVVRRYLDRAAPDGGTAYRDAAAEAVNMLRSVPGRRAVLLMTDGVDINSKLRLDEVIKLASVAEVPIYTMGVGEPGLNEPVDTVLVLDRSGSMRANGKMAALHDAASRFIAMMRSNARTTLLPFSTKVATPGPFKADKLALIRAVNALRPEGGTALYDAAYVGVETLAAARPQGKKAVVVLTDGVDEDPGSRHSDADVIRAAREAHVALHLLGLGPKKEINEAVMRRMAEATGGSFHHVADPKQLTAVFEKLSIDLHDDGINEEELRKLAEKTGGRYFPARDVSKLGEIYGQLAEELQSTYSVTFPSRRQSHDGTARDVEISVVRDGARVSDVGAASYQVRGVVVPTLDGPVYLGMLAVLIGLLALPAVLKRLAGGARSATS